MVFVWRYSFFSLELSAQKTPGLDIKVGGRFIHILIEMDGERDRIRTCDPVIKSHLLYQLSYAPDKSVNLNLNQALWQIKQSNFWWIKYGVTSYKEWPNYCKAQNAKIAGFSCK